jgi:hypothetical protein
MNKALLARVNTAVHTSTICCCKPNACRCKQGAPDALKHGCFPATPVTSLKITGGTAAPPVGRPHSPGVREHLAVPWGWGALGHGSCKRFKALPKVNFSGPGARAGVQLVVLMEAALQPYLSISLREKRVLDTRRREDVRLQAVAGGASANPTRRSHCQLSHMLLWHGSHNP